MNVVQNQIRKITSLLVFLLSFTMYVIIISRKPSASFKSKEEYKKFNRMEYSTYSLITHLKMLLWKRCIQSNELTD